jgi:hypothetical protein
LEWKGKVRNEKGGISNAKQGKKTLQITGHCSTSSIKPYLQLDADHHISLETLTKPHKNGNM